MSWIEAAGDAAIIKVWIQPRASRDAVVGFHAGRLKIAVTAPPIDERANKQLCAFLAAELGLRLGGVKLKSGHRGRQKTVEVAGLSVSAITDRLAPKKSNGR